MKKIATMWIERHEMSIENNLCRLFSEFLTSIVVYDYLIETQRIEENAEKAMREYIYGYLKCYRNDQNEKLKAFLSDHVNIRQIADDLSIDDFTHSSPVKEKTVATTTVIKNPFKKQKKFSCSKLDESY